MEDTASETGNVSLLQDQLSTLRLEHAVASMRRKNEHEPSNIRDAYNTACVRLSFAISQVADVRDES